MTALSGRRRSVGHGDTWNLASLLEPDEELQDPGRDHGTQEDVVSVSTGWEEPAGRPRTESGGPTPRARNGVRQVEVDQQSP